MIFTTKASTAMRLLVELGRHHGDGPVSLKAIAEAEGLPLAYLERIVALKQAEPSGNCAAPRWLSPGARPGRGPHGRGHPRARGARWRPCRASSDDRDEEAAASCARTSPTTGAAARRVCCGCACRVASWRSSTRPRCPVRRLRRRHGRPSAAPAHHRHPLATNRRPCPTSRSRTCVRAGDKEILRGLDLTVSKGEVHASWYNGSGKSTLANAIMGQPTLEVTEGRSTSRARTSPRPTLTSAPRWASSWPSSTRWRSPA